MRKVSVHSGAGACVVALALGPLLLGCSKRREPVVRATAVASLASSRGEVSHRGAGTLVWSTATAGMSLFHRDAIKTGDNAAANVRFVAGSELQIAERALVVIEAPPAEAAPAAAGGASKASPPAKGKPSAVARVEHGQVRGVVQPGAPALRVATPWGKEALITATGDKPATFRASIKKDGKLELAVVAGSAAVRVGDKTTRLGGGQLVEVTRKRVSAPIALLPYPELTAPAVDAHLHAGQRLQLRWKPVPGATLYRVQVSPHLGFESRDVDARITVPEYTLPELQPKKTYVWRVSSIDSAGREGEFGFARRFHILTAAAVTQGLLWPPDNAGFQYVQQAKPITFRWKGEGEAFELVIARVPSLKSRIVTRQRVSAHQATVKRLRRGTFFWGVFVVQGKQRRPLFEKAFRLVLAQRLPPGVQVPDAIGWK